MPPPTKRTKRRRLETPSLTSLTASFASFEAPLWHFLVPEVEQYCLIIPKCVDTRYTVQLMNPHTIRVTSTTTLNNQALEQMASLLQNHPATLKTRVLPQTKTVDINVEYELNDTTEDAVQEYNGVILVLYPLKRKIVINK